MEWRNGILIFHKLLEKNAADSTTKNGKDKMVNLQLNIRNPWATTFKNLGSTFFATPFKNKFIELECYKDSTIVSFNFNWTVRQSHAGLDIELEFTKDVSLVTFVFNWTVRQSHAGLDLELGVFGYNVHFNFYDNRHWDYARGMYTEENINE